MVHPSSPSSIYKTRTLDSQPFNEFFHEYVTIKMKNGKLSVTDILDAMRFEKGFFPESLDSDFRISYYSDLISGTVDIIRNDEDLALAIQTLRVGRRHHPKRDQIHLTVSRKSHSTFLGDDQPVTRVVRMVPNPLFDGEDTLARV